MEGVVLDPLEEVPAAVAEPDVVSMWYDERERKGFVRFGDGGVWSLTDRDAHHFNARDLRTHTGTVFAQRAHLFRFERRASTRREWERRR